MRTFNWLSKAYEEACDLSHKGVKWVDMPKWLKFKIKLMYFIWDWFTWDAVKSGWRMPRLQFKQWLFYKRRPYLKKQI